MISYVFATRDRPRELERSLRTLEGLDAEAHARCGGGEVLVVDNASTRQPRMPKRLTNGLPVRWIRSPVNLGAAGRNLGAEAARGEWLVLLDDDSAPVDPRFIPILDAAPADVAAIGADIRLPGGRREAGGLPEVFVGCGVAVRRSAFLEAGGYDESFGFYAEEYDLCATLIAAGWRIVHDFRFHVRHEKVAAGRDMNLIIQRLVRNNGWVLARYAPPGRRERDLDQMFRRYEQIALAEHAAAGFLLGVAELEETLDSQPERPLPEALYDRFIGLAAVRHTVAAWPDGEEDGARVAIVDRGKHAQVIEQALRERGAIVDDTCQRAPWAMIGTLSPGPMMDAWERRCAAGEPVQRPWRPAGTGAEGVGRRALVAPRA